MTAPSNDLRQEWATARQLYPLYTALAREFVIELPSCADLEAGVDAPPRESVELARQWLVDMDERIQVHQLRQFLQTTTLVDDEALRLLLSHYLAKAKHTEADRDKLDFLLVQFFSHVTPSRLEDADVDLDYVAQTLEPVLGSVNPVVPESLSVVDTFVQTASRSRTLNELLTSGILDKGRKLKVSEGTNYFEPSAMIVFTRFNFLMRRVFFRLMHQDLNAILDGLRDLERNGVNSLDCRRAHCQSWKVMFHAEYSSGQPLRMLVDLRSVVDAALLRSSKTAGKRAIPSESPRTRAAAAGAGAGATVSEVPEFEVLGDASDAGNDGKA